MPYILTKYHQLKIGQVNTAKPYPQMHREDIKQSKEQSDNKPPKIEK